MNEDDIIEVLPSFTEAATIIAGLGAEEDPTATVRMLIELLDDQDGGVARSIMWLFTCRMHPLQALAVAFTAGTLRERDKS